MCSRVPKLRIAPVENGSNWVRPLMEALEHATGYVRKRLSERLGLRASPEIRFVFDPSVEYGIRLEELIEETKKRSPEDDPGETDS